MPVVKILLIESGRASAPSYAPALEKRGYRVSTHHKIGPALTSAQKESPDLVVLDAASMQASGARMCRALRESLNGVPILLVSPKGSSPARASGASAILVQPFTARKLMNRVARLVPADARFTLEVGPIKLNLAQRSVRCLGRESRLTPKQARLLEVFLHNPERLLTRESLIRQVWHTDYTGDTRTLDVHMSWLRHAVEPDPKRPRFLKTIRGMGYRLDLPTGQ
ncbi:MAG TPA: response regulator transcription factor [Anaerolineales bacterium]|nr:response regulator transcription factor [Anaerolineales bacterium]